MNVQLAEPTTEVLLLIHIDRLIAKEDHEILQQGTMDLIELLIAQRLRQIDPMNFRTNVGRHLAHLDGVIAHWCTPYRLRPRAKSLGALIPHRTGVHGCVTKAGSACACVPAPANLQTRCACDPAGDCPRSGSGRARSRTPYRARDHR